MSGANWSWPKGFTLSALDATLLAIRGQGSERVFQIDPMVKVSISGLTIRWRKCRYVQWRWY